MMAHDNGISKREFLIFFYKYRRRLLGAFLITLGIFVIISFIPTPRYKATSTLIVRLGSEYVYQPEVSQGDNSNNNPIPFNPEQIFKSEVAILDSDFLHAETIKAVGIATIYPKVLNMGIMDYIHKFLGWIGIEDALSPDEIAQQQLANAIELFDKRFDILLEKESAVIDITFEHKDPKVAAATLDTLIRLYLEKRKTLFIEQRAGLAESELLTSRKHAVETEYAEKEFLKKYKIYSFTDERADILKHRDEAKEQATKVYSKSLDRRIADYNQQLDRLDKLEKDYNILSHEAQIAGDSYALFSKKYDDARAYEDQEYDRYGSVRIIQPAMVPADPKRLQPYIILAGIFVSVLSTLFVAALTGYTKNTFTTSEEIEYFLQIPVLAVFQRFSAYTNKPAEPLRHLIQRINLFLQNKPKSVITFISARSGEGTSQIAWDYALELFAETNQKILFMDAGKFVPELFTEKGIKHLRAIADNVAEGKTVADAIYETAEGISLCKFILDEEKRVTAGQLIQSTAFWKELHNSFDTIIIDTYSLQHSFDGVAFAVKSDATIMVIEAEKTPHAVVKNLRDILNSAGATIAGAVMNKRRHYIPAKIYNKL